MLLSVAIKEKMSYILSKKVDYMKYVYKIKLCSLVAQRIKHLPAMWETWVRSLDWEDPLEKEMATHSSILVWRINPMDRAAWWATVHRVPKSQT